MACLFALSFTSCATIMSGGTPTIHLEGKIDEPVTIVTERNTYPNVTLPINVQINRHKLEGQRIKISSENYEYNDIILSKSFNGTTILNIFIGGVVGWVVDMATNCVSLPSQKNYYVTPIPKVKK